MAKVYAVIDTNVIVSALLSRHSDAATVRVLESISKVGICPLYNQEIIDEYRDVLSRPKFCFPQNLINLIINRIVKIGQDSTRIHSDETFPDSKDVVFYEVALSKEDAYLVTGNTKHFPNSPIVVTPAEMIAILEEMGL